MLPDRITGLARSHNRSDPAPSAPAHTSTRANSRLLQGHRRTGRLPTPTGTPLHPAPGAPAPWQTRCRSPARGGTGTHGHDTTAPEIISPAPSAPGTARKWSAAYRWRLVPRSDDLSAELPRLIRALPHSWPQIAHVTVNAATRSAFPGRILIANHVIRLHRAAGPHTPNTVHGRVSRRRLPARPLPTAPPPCLIKLLQGGHRGHRSRIPAQDDARSTA